MDRYEKQWAKRGKRQIVGVDEVGRGALAGPVVCALVMLDRNQPIAGLKDSKQLSAAKREELAAHIYQKALVVDWCQVDAPRIDQINILEATKEAMLMLLNRHTFDHALIDAVDLKREDATPIIKGDTLSMSIAAASIIAKVERDAMMRELTTPWTITRHSSSIFCACGPCPPNTIRFVAVGYFFFQGFLIDSEVGSRL